MTKKIHKNEPSRLIRFVFYPSVAILFVLSLATVLVLANGYKPNFRFGKISLEKIGMFIIGSHPSDAQVFLNGKYQLNTGYYLFPSKITGLLPGKYNLTVKKSGYKEWKNNFEIVPGLVSWANYILLFPEKLNIKQVILPNKVPIAKSQNNDYWLFDESIPEKTIYNLYKLSDGSVKNMWPESQAGLLLWQSKPLLSSATISPSSDRVIYAIKNGEITNYIMTDGSGKNLKLIDINAQFTQSPDQVVWDNFDNNKIFIKVKTDLYKVNTSSNSLGHAIQTGVNSFYEDINGQIYLVVTQLGRSSISKTDTDGNNLVVLADSIDPQTSYIFAASTKVDALAYINTATNELWLMSPTSNDKTIITKIAKGAKGIIWHKDGKKLGIWGDKYYARYDFERKKLVSVSSANDISSLGWYYDDSHFIVSEKGALYISEFDGNYRVVLSDSAKLISTLGRVNNDIIFGKEENNTLYSRFVSPY
ncbi:MAG: PEGA domain-containing protein [bacterium]